MKTQELEERFDYVLKQHIERIIVSNASNRNGLYRKIDILNKVDHFMVTKYTEKFDN